VLQQRSVINWRTLANCCVWNYTGRNTPSANNQVFRFSHVTRSPFTLKTPPTWRHAWFSALLNDVTVPRVYSGLILLLGCCQNCFHRLLLFFNLKISIHHKVTRKNSSNNNRTALKQIIHCQCECDNGMLQPRKLITRKFAHKIRATTLECNAGPLRSSIYTYLVGLLQNLWVVKDSSITGVTFDRNITFSV